MRNLILISCLFILSFNGIVAQQSLSPEQQHLSVIQGKWTIVGSESTYLEVCDWIQGNHMQCLSTSKEEEGTDNSISYLTYSTAEKAYVYYGIYGSGGSRTLRGTWNSNGFVFEGERVSPEKTTKWKVTMELVDNDHMNFLEVKSIDNGEWKKSARFQYIRVN